jgi:hypothetical protein
VSSPILYFKDLKKWHDCDTYRPKGRSRHCKCSHSGDFEDYCFLSSDAV